MDWMLAAKVASGGFGMVFFVLAILFVAIILTKEVIGKFILKKEVIKNDSKIVDLK
jgi:Na+-transporting methylmalonyl-CoA/oxaloacetate decarboxylase gamma subunit